MEEQKSSRVDKELSYEQKTIIENVICFAGMHNTYHDRERYITDMFLYFRDLCKKEVENSHINIVPPQHPLLSGES